MNPSSTTFSSASNGFNGMTSEHMPPVAVGHDESVRLGEKNDFIRDGFFRLSSLTHDTYVATQHTCIKQLGEDLQAAAKAAWPKQEGNRYSQVCVILLSWVTDDLGVASEVQRLRHVFEDMYQFQVETYQIPDKKPDRALKGRILEFLVNDQDSSLLIFYYAGHAKRGQNEGPLWFPNRHSSLITVPSSGIQTLLEEADSDVLLLYDCCHSAAITTTGYFQGNKGVKEVISACGYETIAPEVDEHSFTNALIETLALVSKGTPFSVGELHSRVLSRLKCWTASLVYDDDGKVLKTPEGNLVSERQPRRTPIYSILRESTPRRSIVLAPLTLAQPAPGVNTHANPSITPSNATPGLDIDGKAISSKKSKKRKRATAKEPSWPQIVLSVRLDEAELEISTWREWIRSLPAEAKDIKIEGMYRSFSTLLLIRMPVSIWNLLPDNGAYSFVGYVTSENLSLQDLETPAWSEEVLDKPQATKNVNEHPKGISSVQEALASACVPCKRAHTRCNNQRPCSRCLEKGKEDACVDVQHKKRGRPRLRDERESRYEGGGPDYPAPEASMRRPLSFYEGQMVSGFSDPPHRTHSYRVLKSQVGSMPGPVAPLHIDWANVADANIYGGSIPPTPRMLPSQEIICAYLSMEMQIAKTTQNFGDTVVLQPIVGRKLQDVLSPNDREKAHQLQRIFEQECREREPKYLPPIYLGKFEEDRAIQSVGFGHEEIGQLRTDHQEVFTFSGSDGQQRTFHVRLGLAKKEATYFIVLVLQVPGTPQQYQIPRGSSTAARST